MNAAHLLVAVIFGALAGGVVAYYVAHHRLGAALAELEQLADHLEETARQQADARP